MQSVETTMAVILMFQTLGLQGLLFAQDSYNTCFEDCDLDVDESYILRKFPGLFKSKEEIQILLEERGTDAGYDFVDSGTSLETSTTKPPHGAGASNSETVYHGCCASNRTFNFYQYLTNQREQVVKLVQFPRMKQWFDVDTCVSQPNCSDCNCACHHEERFHTALVYNPEFRKKNYAAAIILDSVRVKSVCRCVNNAPELLKRPSVSFHTRDEF